MLNIKINNGRIWVIVILLTVSVKPLLSQHGTFSSVFGTEAGYITPDRMPFWLRANKAGSIPEDNFSISVLGSAYKNYESRNKQFDWATSFSGRINISENPGFILIEGNASLRMGIFEVKGGRSKEVMGLCDTSLSSGSFAVSGNAPGIPELQVSVPEYYTIPALGQLFAFKGGFSHGWLGKIPRKNADSIIPMEIYFHQAWLYGRIGRPDGNLKFYGGFNHQVFWGNENEFYGDSFTLSPLETFLYVISGKSYGNDEIASSRVGNHLGSIDLAVEWKIKDVDLFVYRQTFYDIGALYHFANLRDGLYGISLKNMKEAGKGFHWNKILAEYLFTKNQAGEFWSPVTPSGDEDYYNNYQFVKGYSYYGFGIGSPFAGTRAWISDDLPDSENDYFINNRIVAVHIGSELAYNKWNMLVRASWSWNRGTYATSPEGRSIGTVRYPPEADIFPLTRQFSGYFELIRQFPGRISLGIISAFDLGELYYNSSGILVALSKSF